MKIFFLNENNFLKFLLCAYILYARILWNMGIFQKVTPDINYIANDQEAQCKACSISLVMPGPLKQKIGGKPPPFQRLAANLLCCITLR